MWDSGLLKHLGSRKHALIERVKIMGDGVISASVLSRLGSTGFLMGKEVSASHSPDLD